jgi:L-arabinose isomerase
MIDSPLKVPAAVELFQSERIEILFLYVSTYALSCTVLPIAQRVKIPIVVLNLQPVAVVKRENRVGVLDHYYGGMLDVYSDLTRQSAAFGNHFELLEIDELKLLRDQATEQQVQKKLEQFQREFKVSEECSEEELRRTAGTSCALDMLVSRYQLGSLAYYYEGSSGSEHEDIITSVIAGNFLLTANHVPVAGECEVKNVQAMKIMDAFDAGGSFSEFNLMDFEEDLVFLGHDGPAHFAIAGGEVELVPLPVYHGKPGKGNTNSRCRFCIGARYF